MIYSASRIHREWPEMNLSDIKRLLDYTEWANGLALNAAAELAGEDLGRECDISHGSIFGTLLHMAGADWILLERWHGRSPAGEEAWSLWKTESCAHLATLSERWREGYDRRARFISQLDEARLKTQLP